MPCRGASLTTPAASRAAAGPALPQPGRRHVRGRHRLGRAGVVPGRLRPRRRRGRLRQRRPARPVRHPVAVVRALPQPGRRHVRGRHRARGARRAAATGRPRRPSPTSTATATSTSTSATTPTGTRDDRPPCPHPTRPGENIYCHPRSFAGMPDHVFRNDGGRFVDVTESSGVACGRPRRPRARRRRGRPRRRRPGRPLCRQ